MKRFTLFELVELFARPRPRRKNPGGTRRIRLGRHQAFTVEIDRATKKILAGAGVEIPRTWIGLPWQSVAPLERKVRNINRDLKRCLSLARCHEPRRDRIGRRRPCVETIPNRRALLEALDDAAGGVLLRGYDPAVEYMDPGSEVLDNLRKYAGRRRARHMGTWKEAIASFAMPRTRRWRDVDRYTMERLAEYVHEELARESYPHHVSIRVPEQTDRLRQAEDAQVKCEQIAGDGRVRARLEAEELVAAALAGVPF
jgi:hypothetical protein